MKGEKKNSQIRPASGWARYKEVKHSANNKKKESQPIKKSNDNDRDNELLSINLKLDDWAEAKPASGLPVYNRLSDEVDKVSRPNNTSLNKKSKKTEIKPASGRPSFQKMEWDDEEVKPRNRSSKKRKEIKEKVKPVEKWPELKKKEWPEEEPEDIGQLYDPKQERLNPDNSPKHVKVDHEKSSLVEQMRQHWMKYRVRRDSERKKVDDKTRRLLSNQEAQDKQLILQRQRKIEQMRKAAGEVSKEEAAALESVIENMLKNMDESGIDISKVDVEQLMQQTLSMWSQRSKKIDI